MDVRIKCFVGTYWPRVEKFDTLAIGFVGHDWRIRLLGALRDEASLYVSSTTERRPRLDRGVPRT